MTDHIQPMQRAFELELTLYGLHLGLTREVAVEVAVETFKQLVPRSATECDVRGVLDLYENVAYVHSHYPEATPDA